MIVKIVKDFHFNYVNKDKTMGLVVAVLQYNIMVKVMVILPSPLTLIAYMKHAVCKLQLKLQMVVLNKLRRLLLIKLLIRK